MKKTSTHILNRMMAPLGQLLTPESARKFASVKDDPMVRKRIDQLARKANRGTLTMAENKEYGTYIQLLDIMAILKIEAEAILQESLSK